MADREELIGFYGGVGFEVTRELRAFDIPIWCMMRPAATRRCRGPIGSSWRPSTASPCIGCCVGFVCVALIVPLVKIISDVA